MSAVIAATFAPFIRLQGSVRLGALLNKLNYLIAQYYPLRRSFPRENKNYQRNYEDKNWVFNKVENNLKAKDVRYKVTDFTNQRKKVKEHKVVLKIASEQNKGKKNGTYKTVLDKHKNSKFVTNIQIRKIDKKDRKDDRKDKTKHDERVGNKKTNKTNVKELTVETGT